MDGPGLRIPKLARKRRRLSLSLRALMVLVLIVGAPMAWKARRASIQRRAVARIKALHGSVIYDWQYGGNVYQIKPAKGPSAPVWLRNALGDEYFQEVAMVFLGDEIPSPPEMGNGSDAPDKRADEKKAFDNKYVRPIDEDQLACLDGFDRLECLVVVQPFTWNPEGVARLVRLVRLREFVYLGQLDRDTMGHLSKLTNLETLSLILEVDQKPDLSFLDKMPRLRQLVIPGGPLTDDNMERIGRARNLRHLGLMGFDLTQEGLSQIQNLPHLKDLSIMALMRKPSPVGWDLAALENLDDLESLDLSGVPANKSGLERLRKLPKLATLTLSGSHLDGAAIQEFKAAKPGVKVSFSP